MLCVLGDPWRGATWRPRPQPGPKQGPMGTLPEVTTAASTWMWVASVCNFVGPSPHINNPAGPEPGKQSRVPTGSPDVPPGRENVSPEAEPSCPHRHPEALTAPLLPVSSRGPIQGQTGQSRGRKRESLLDRTVTSKSRGPWY